MRKQLIDKIYHSRRHNLPASKSCYHRRRLRAIMFKHNLARLFFISGKYCQYQCQNTSGAQQVHTVREYNLGEQPSKAPRGWHTHTRTRANLVSPSTPVDQNLLPSLKPQSLKLGHCQICLNCREKILIQSIRSTPAVIETLQAPKKKPSQCRW